MDVCYHLENMEQVAQQVWNELSHYPVWALHGDMGVGKTTFTQTLCRKILRTPDNVSSPTFALINQYENATIGTICHIDLYRLHDGEEAIQAGVEDAIESADFSLVEWPEIAPEIFPERTAHLIFTLLPDGRRHLVTTTQFPVG